MNSEDPDLKFVRINVQRLKSCCTRQMLEKSF